MAQGLVLAPLAGAQLRLSVALEGAGEASHDGAAHRLVDGLVGDEARRMLVEAEATLEHGLVGGAGQGHALRRVQVELLEEGGAEGFHDVGGPCAGSSRAPARTRSSPSPVRSAQAAARPRASPS